MSHKVNEYDMDADLPWLKYKASFTVAWNDDWQLLDIHSTFNIYSKLKVSLKLKNEIHLWNKLVSCDFTMWTNFAFLKDQWIFYGNICIALKSYRKQSTCKHTLPFGKWNLVSGHISL